MFDGWPYALHLLGHVLNGDLYDTDSSLLLWKMRVMMQCLCAFSLEEIPSGRKGAIVKWMDVDGGRLCRDRKIERPWRRGMS